LTETPLFLNYAILNFFKIKLFSPPLVMVELTLQNYYSQPEVAVNFLITSTPLQISTTQFRLPKAFVSIWLWPKQNQK